MTDAAIAQAVEIFMNGETLTDEELDALLELHHDLIYKLNIFGNPYRECIKSLRAGLKTLEDLQRFRHFQQFKGKKFA